MARVVMQAVVSVDGYIAYPDDTVGHCRSSGSPTTRTHRFTPRTR